MVQSSCFAVLSASLPPSPSGQALVLDKLLRGFPIESYCLLSTEWHPPRPDSARYYYLKSHNTALFSVERSLAASVSSRQTSAYQPLFRGLRRVYRLGKRLVNSALSSSASRLIEDRAQQILEAIKHENCALIVGCSGEPYDLPAAHRASQLSGIPFVAFVMDYYGHSQAGPQGQLARRLEPAVITDAQAVLVLNEYMAQTYAREYNVSSTIIRTPCVMPEPLPPARHTSLFPHNTINIVYTGAIYSAHYDSFRRLIAAIRALKRNDVKLHIFTSNPPAVLALEGISEPDVTFHEYLPPKEIIRVQQQADILFLPLAFQSEVPKLIATSSPSKTADYLSSGKAVLVHAPPDSFLSWYFRQHDCGAVVDREDVGQMTETLRRLIDDVAWREQLGQAAYARALADFDLAVVGPRFVHALETAAGVRFT